MENNNLENKKNNANTLFGAGWISALMHVKVNFLERQKTKPLNINKMKKTKEECLLMNGIMSYDLGKNEARIMKAMDDWANNVAKNNIVLPNVSGQSELLFAFIAEVKKEFANQNWDCLDFIAERVLKANSLNTPVVIKSVCGYKLNKRDSQGFLSTPDIDKRV